MFNLGQMVIMVHLHILAEGTLVGWEDHLPASGVFSSHPANLKPGNVDHRTDRTGREKNALNKKMHFLQKFFWNLFQQIEPNDQEGEITKSLGNIYSQDVPI